MKLMDIAEVQMGYGFRSKIVNKPDGTVRVIQPKDIPDDGQLQVADVFRVRMESVKPDKFLKKGDVLLGSRGRFACTVFENQLNAPTIASGSLLILSVKDGMALPGYLAIYFNSQKGNAELNRITERTTIPYLNQSALGQLDIPLPGLETQKKLIALERVKQRYSTLTTRKTELLNTLINQQLSTTN